MKKLISILLVCVLAFSVTACTNADKENQESQASQSSQENTVTETQTQSADNTDSQEPSTLPSIDSQKVSITVPVMKTKDWNNYEFSEYNGKEEMTVTMDIPESYSSDATVIYNSENVKCAEVVGIVPYADGQTPFDTIETDKKYNDITYFEKEEGELANGVKCYVASGTSPIEDGEWYVYAFAVDFGEYCVRITMYSETKFDGLSDECQVMLGSIKAE